MTTRSLAFLAAGLAASAPLGVALSARGEAAPPSAETGDSLYRAYCSSCHGLDGKGDDPLASSLRVRPADLTRLAKRGGKFDADKVAKAIDGRQAVAGHGDSDMPKWGDAFKRSGEGYSEAAVKERIAALVAHLEGLQVK